MTSQFNHWNKIFEETDDHRLGWFEDDPVQTLGLLERVGGWERATIFLPGAGTSRLVERLLDAGAHLVVNDLSSSALALLGDRLGNKAACTQWVCQNVADPLGTAVPEVDVWIDRAVLHFLIDEEEICGYFKNLKAKLKRGGHALFAEFPPHGAPKCAGLELHQYTVEGLAERLGGDFVLVDSFDHVYINPNGDPRPYIYALFKRMK
jgi:hypothetical protein